MSELRARVAELARDAAKEVQRSRAPTGIPALDDHQRRWAPLLADLIEVVGELAEECEEAGAIPVDLVARAVGLIIAMVNQLGRPVPEAEVAEIAERAAEVTEELLALVDPDELAAYCRPDAAPTAVSTAEGVTPEAEPIDQPSGEA